ncbi:AtaL-like protein [Solimonas flava]|uniref:AtaL-like protein n=1 Tax=Solimonas flava TaxID=415849 RepID=UPI0004021358|nr:AtaL-like protein [Solimonas flava]
MGVTTQRLPEAIAVDAGDTPLRFEHLVQINDPRDERLEALSRLQLWRGLLLRAQTPQLFIPWLDSAAIDSDDDGTLTRTLRFGDYEVRDRVSFAEPAVHYEIVGPQSDSRFSLTMRIEEPSPGMLFVRFTYEALSVDHHAQSPLGDMVKGAYRMADEDTVFRIRQLAASGVLDEH